MAMNKSLDRTVLSFAVLGSLVLVNVIGLAIFGRLDLTHDDQFTLSRATKSALRDVKDPITIRAYFTRELPPPYSSNARYVRDLLEEYYAAGRGNVRYEFIDPESEETAEDKEKKKEVKQDIFGRAVREATTVERELQGLGIQPVQVRVNQDDKLEVKRAYMGIAVIAGDKKEVIPVVSETGGLEYDLTTMIKKMTREKTPKLALLSGQGGPDPQKEISRMYSLLGQQYQVTQVDLSQEAQIADDVDALLVVGPKTRLSENALRSIDSFVTAGKSAAFLLDTITTDLQTLQTTDTDHGLTEMLAAYGVKVENNLVLDADCATINIAQQRGPFRVAQPVRYPFMPLPQSLDPNHPLTRGLSQVVFPFMSALTVTADNSSGLKSEVLVKTSGKAWSVSRPFNLDPLQRWTLDGVSDQGVKNLVVALNGPIKSYFGGVVDAGGSGAHARILVAGGAGFVNDQFLQKGNEAFVLNLIDWLVLDEDLLAVRSRGLSSAPLKELGDGTRNGLKYFNIVGVPVILVVFGLLRWRARENRRGRVALA